MNKYYTVNFAQAYGESTYSACTYNDTTSCETSSGGGSSGSGSGSSNGGGLANTGIMVIAFVTLACLIIFVALVARLWRRPSKKLATAEVATETSDDDQQLK